jgi:2-methylcitrate dehydratase PrpD
LFRVVAHVLDTRHADIPEAALTQARTFLLDSFGVGVAGSAGAHVATLLQQAERWGAGDEATAWVWGNRLPAPAAAFLNAYQMHCLEFDCVHERAVLHPMTVVMPAALADAERRAARGETVSGRDFLDACVIGVEVTVLLGAAATGAMRFFRPATCGGFGAVAAIGRLRGFDPATLASAFGLQYGQTGGTLQPHDEGSPLLGLQVGFAARGAINSCDFAAAGIQGPLDVLTGRYGYFPLYEGDQHALDTELDRLGKPFRMTEVSHKPFPTGRLTHGALTGLMRITGEVGAERIATVTCHVPPLVARLVGRPDVPEPASNYAKLCLPFVLGTWLARGAADLPHFRDAATLADPAVHAAAARVRIVVDDNPDQNAMGPVRVVAVLTDGSTREAVVPYALGHPRAALTPAQNVEKFRKCWADGGLAPAAADQLIAAVDAIDTLDDVTALARLLSP